MRTLPCLSAVLLAAALAGCAAQPKTVAAPEYDWAAGFEETCARLDEAGLSYTATPAEDGGYASILLESGALFEVTAGPTSLLFNPDLDELESVRAEVAPGDAAAMQSAMQKALGAPLDGEYTYAAFDALRSSTLEASLRSMPTGETFIVWLDSEPLSESWTEEEQTAFAEALCAKLGSSPAEHEEAFATYFAHNWEHQARLEILSDGSAIVTLSRLIQPF